MQVTRFYRANQTLLQLKPVLFKYITLSCLMLLLAGCAQPKIPTSSVQGSILPVADSANLPDVIKALLSQSDAQYANKNYTGALATLERAVRINPRQPEIWSRMAQVYVRQGKLEQARQHAKRSNSVVKNNPSLKAFNQQIINPKAVEQVK